MKLTLKQLKRIIKEELNKTMNESAYHAGWAAGRAGDDHDDSAWPGEEGNYEEGYTDGQKSEDPESPFGSDSGDGDKKPQPSQTSQAFAKFQKERPVRDFAGTVEAEEERRNWGDLAPADPTEIYNINLMRKVVADIEHFERDENGKKIRTVSDEQIDLILRRHAKPQG